MADGLVQEDISNMEYTEQVGDGVDQDPLSGDCIYYVSIKYLHAIFKVYVKQFRGDQEFI